MILWGINRGLVMLQIMFNNFELIINSLEDVTKVSQGIEMSAFSSQSWNQNIVFKDKKVCRQIHNFPPDVDIRINLYIREMFENNNN